MRSLFYTLIFISFCSCSVLHLGPVCEIKSQAFHSDGFEVNTTIYTPKDLKKKTLILVPPTGGTNYIDRKYAELFSRRGYRVIILNSWTNDNEKTYDLEVHQRFYQGAQEAIRLAIQNSRVENPDGFIGLLGTSVGALHSIIAASAQKDLNAVFAIVGGISIAEVIVTSDQKAMRTLHKKRESLYDLNTDQQQIEAIDKAFKLEPINLGNGFKQKTLGVSVATDDKTVAYATQINLIQFWKPTMIIENTGSHFWGIIKTWFLHSDEVLQFFETTSAIKS